MMRPAENIEKLINRLRVEPRAEMSKRNLDDALAAHKKVIGSVSSRPTIWRTIMKSRITKLSAAAVIIIAVLISINQFSGSIDGASVAWGNVAEKVENIETYVFRMRTIKTTGPREEGFEFATEKETMVYQSGRYGERTETYTNGELSTQSYTHLEKNEFVGIIPPAKKYEREPLTEARIRRLHNGHPKRIVMQILQGDYVELGRDKIDGKDVQGVEIYNPAVFYESPPPVEDFVVRLWIDTQTELPVWVEISFVEEGSSLQSTIVIDQFQWDVELVADDFEPNIPSDYKLFTHDGPVPLTSSAGVEQSESFFAENTVNEPYLSDFEDAQLPDLEQLTLLGVVNDARKSNVRLVGHIEIWKTQDEFIRDWPIYKDVRARLYQELLDKLDIEQLSVEELVATGIALRKKFWELGGCLSKTSYAYGYASRIVLERAHEQAPDNMAIIDELVESICSCELVWQYQENGAERIKNPCYPGILTELRSKQFGRIRTEVAQGRMPTWKDFLQVHDLAILFSSAKDYESALKTTVWLISEAHKAGWIVYLDTLKYMESDFASGQGYYGNIYLPGLNSFPEEYRYGRRLPSFQGPDQRRRRLVPFHIKDPQKRSRLRSD